MITIARLGWLTIAVAVVLALTVPLLRDGWRTVLLRAEIIHPDILSPVILRQIASESPEDPNVQLALLYRLEQIHPAHGHPDIEDHLPSEEETREHFRRIMDRFPDDPAPAFLYAEHLIIDLRYGLDLPMELDSAPVPYLEPRLPTEEDIATAREIRDILHRAARNAPENAAIDYALAWAWLVEDRREEAFAALTRAAGKPRHSLYQARICDGMTKLIKPTGDPYWFSALIAPTFAFQPTIAGGTYRRQLARALGSRGSAAREAQDHELALELGSATITYGSQLRNEAWWSIEPLVASAISGIDRRALASPEMGSGLSPEEVERLRAETAAAYAREHGRDDLARFILQEAATDRRVRSHVSQSAHHSETWLWRPLSWAGWPTAMATWVTIGIFGVFLAGMVVLVALEMAMRRRRCPRREEWIAVHPLTGLGLLAVLFVPGWISASLLAARAEIEVFMTPPLFDWHPLMALGVPLWFLGALAIAAWYGRREDRADVAPTEKLLRVADSLLEITVPALVLAGVLALGGMVLELNTAGDALWETLRVGEIEFFALDAPADEFRARMIELCGEAAAVGEWGGAAPD